MLNACSSQQFHGLFIPNEARCNQAVVVGHLLLSLVLPEFPYISALSLPFGFPSLDLSKCSSTSLRFRPIIIGSDLNSAMQAPCITLHSTTQSNFRHNDGYEGVSVTDLEILLRQGREVTTSLEGELMKRHHERTSDQPGELGRCCERLHNTARELSVKERLDGRAAKQVDDAVEILTTSQTASSSKTYQAFLYDILRHCSPSLVLLCAASLGKNE